MENPPINGGFNGKSSINAGFSVAMVYLLYFIIIIYICVCVYINIYIFLYTIIYHLVGFPEVRNFVFRLIGAAFGLCGCTSCLAVGLTDLKVIAQ